MRENFSCITYVKIVKSVREKCQMFFFIKKMFLLNKQNSAKNYPKFNIIYYRNSVKLNHSFSLVSSHILTKFTVYSSWKPSNQQITGFTIVYLSTRNTNTPWPFILLFNLRCRFFGVGGGKDDQLKNFKIKHGILNDCWY